MKINSHKILYIIVIIISVLLIFNVFLSVKVSQTIVENIHVQQKTDSIKFSTKDIVRHLHGMDMALRGYALNSQGINVVVYQESVDNLNLVFDLLERKTIPQGFPIEYLNKVKLSFKVYQDSLVKMIDYISIKDTTSFNAMYNKYYGETTYEDYKEFENNLYSFEAEISDKANRRYNTALQQNKFLSFSLLIIIIPVLFYAVFKVTKNFNLIEKLKQLEEDRNLILAEQNTNLEDLVNSRTQKIELQKDEIQAQNEDLLNANKLIESQNEIIKSKNLELNKEVKRQNENLKISNVELASRIEKMEQFTFIVSHNLKSYVSQIKGLSTIFEYSEEEDERKTIINQIRASITNLDGVLNDLSSILQIENESNRERETVSMEKTLQIVLKGLSDKIEETNAKIEVNLDIDDVTIVPAFLNSILFNLISNAIKYKRRNVDPIILIQTRFSESDFVLTVKDNGMGIDLNLHKDSIFSIYKRFHSDVEGKGLGLHLCKIQVESMGGKIDLESVVNEGTTFTIHIPQKK
ncbi:MAG: HAMP domain-containing histidine kinase [Cyclobacteriaceae bacterium]|nr:HAMP domain-containing histidine kinase [Cyclobacteriaceae bacterium]